MWIRPTDLTASTNRIIISQGTSAATNNLLNIAIVWPSSTTIYFRFGFYSNELDTIAFTASNYLNQWIHITATYDWTTRVRNLYINGILTATGIQNTY